MADSRKKPWRSAAIFLSCCGSAEPPSLDATGVMGIQGGLAQSLREFERSPEIALRCGLSGLAERAKPS